MTGAIEWSPVVWDYVVRKTDVHEGWIGQVIEIRRHRHVMVQWPGGGGPESWHVRKLRPANARKP